MERLQELFRILVLIAGFVNGLLFIPQMVALRKAKSAREFSFLTFGGFLVIMAVFFTHGLLERNLYLAAGVAVSLLFCGATIAVAANLRFRDRQTRNL